MSKKKAGPVPEVRSTLDHDIFWLDESNRPIIPKKLERMISDIAEKNLLHLFPIVVGSDMGIRDGQHRWSAAKALGVPIYYIISDDMEIIDVGMAARNTHSWRLSDFVHFYAARERDQGIEGDYTKLDNLIKSSPLLTVTTVLSMASIPRSQERTRADVVRNGWYTHSEDTDEIVRSVLDLNEKISEYTRGIANTTTFLSALKMALQHPEFDPDRFIDKLHAYHMPIFRRGRATDYLRQIQHIYNYRQRTNRTILVEDDDAWLS